jgi:hypothetical protein
MQRPRTIRIRMLLLAFSATVALVSPIALSGAITTVSAATAPSIGSAAAASAAETMVPNEKLHWEFYESYSDTPTGKAYCQENGKQFVKVGGAASWQCILDDPDNNRWNLWLEVY